MSASIIDTGAHCWALVLTCCPSVGCTIEVVRVLFLIDCLQLFASFSVSYCVRCREMCTFTTWFCNKATRQGSLLHWWHPQPCSKWHDTCWPAKDVLWNEDVCSSLLILVGGFALRWWIDCVRSSSDSSSLSDSKLDIAVISSSIFSQWDCLAAAAAWHSSRRLTLICSFLSNTPNVVTLSDFMLAKKARSSGLSISFSTFGDHSGKVASSLHSVF